MNLDILIDTVNTKTGLDIRDSKKTTDQVMARCIYYKLAYEDFRLGSLQMVAMKVGKNHATVLHAIKNLFPVMHTYFPQMYKDYISIKRDLDGISESDILDEKYNDLLKKYNELMSNDSEIMSIIRRVPEDKLSIFKLRISAIVKMLRA